LPLSNLLVSGELVEPCTLRSNFIQRVIVDVERVVLFGELFLDIGDTSGVRFVYGEVVYRVVYRKQSRLA